MTNDLAFNQVDHVLRDVGGEVGNPFEMPRGGQEMHGAFSRVIPALSCITNMNFLYVATYVIAIGSTLNDLSLVASE